MAVLRKNVAYNVLLAVSQILFPLFTFPYASRVLGPEAIGTISFADSFTTYFLILSGLGIPLYGIREIAKVKHDVKLLGQTFSELFFIHLACSILSAILLFVLSTTIPRLTEELPLYQIGIAILLGSTFISEWFFQGLDEFKYIAVRTVLVRLFTVVLMFFLVKTPDDKTVYYGLNLVAIVLSGGINFYLISKKVKISTKDLSIKKHLKPLFIMLSSALVSTGYLIFDTVILGFLKSNSVVGYYSAAMRISKISLSLMSAVSIALLPRFSVVFHQKDHSEAYGLVNKSLRFAVFISVPISVGIYCLSTEIITVFAGTAYLPAIDSLKILCWLVILISLAQVFSNQILLPLKQERKILYATIMGVVISLSANFALIPSFGHAGAATSSLLTELAVTLAVYTFAIKSFSFSLPLQVFGKSLFTSLLFFIVHYLVLQITALPIVVLIFTVSISGAVYLGVQLLVWRNRDMIEALSAYPSFSFISRLK